MNSSNQPFNPFSDDVARSLITLFEAQPLVSLPPLKDDLKCCGVYAIYYRGDLEIYDRPQKFKNLLIYVGKAVLPGGRKGSPEITIANENYVRTRLAQHATSIRATHNLDINDFRCRWLNVVPEFVSAAEVILINHFHPLWNKTVSGFGLHNPGSERGTTARSDWDTIHPGRHWAENLSKGASLASIQVKINEYFKSEKKSRYGTA